MKLPDDLLRLPVSRGARLIALQLIDAARKTTPRLDNAEDAEALHDFRVSLRRLRSVLRAYRSQLKPPFPKKMIRRIKKIASATGAGRDSEVQAHYLREWEPELPPAKRKGAAWLREKLEERARENYSRPVEAARAAFLELEPALLEALRPPGFRPPAATVEPSFGRALADLSADTGATLSRRLAGIESARDIKRAHRARIEGKRLRYLIDILKGRSTAWKRCVSNLKGLQDILGELHDMHVLEDELNGTMEELAVAGVRGQIRRAVGDEPARARTAKPLDPIPGLLKVSRLVRDRQKLLFRRLQRRWGEVQRARFFGELAALGEGLRRIRTPKPPATPPSRTASATKR